MTGRPIITLTTDFGVSSPYVAAMKAAILSRCSDVQLIDISHAIAPQDVRQGAVVLHDVTPGFPPNTIHMGVVDPGVGTTRSVVFAKIGDQRYIAPNNGLLSYLARKQPCTELITLCEDRFWCQPVSPTFHGRDIMAPVAAHLCMGVTPGQLGAPLDRLEQLNWPDVQASTDSLTGRVLIVDPFGNLVTDIERTSLPRHIQWESVSVHCRGTECASLRETYGHAAVSELIALFGSSNRLEIAVNQGNAAERIGASVGDEVHVTWAVRGGAHRQGGRST
jgi:S-adenosylmethionine hydrolase